MKTLLINGSPCKENSTTLIIAKKFLEGMEETPEVIHTIDLNANPCRACYACWAKADGKCAQNDAATAVLEKMKKADVIIWAIPLFCYSAPSHCKALMDRTISFNSAEMYMDADGQTHHYGYEDGSKKTVLISSAALPDVEGNFDGLVFQLKRMFGSKTATVLCAESELFLNPRAGALTNAYLENVKCAGAEYKNAGKISENTQKILDTPMIPKELYIQNTNASFTAMKSRLKIVS